MLRSRYIIALVALALAASATTWVTRQALAQTATSQPSQKEILDRMLRDRIDASPVMPTVPGQTATAPSDTATTPDGQATKLLPERTMIARRLGRMVRQGQWWTFAFESDGKAMADPPMRLLPCAALELMEIATEGGKLPVKFQLSGRVTKYRGNNYLLPENFLTVRGQGNFQ